MRKVILYGVGLAISVLPVTICTLSYFPLWRNEGVASVLSGFAFILLMLCFTPLFNSIKRIFRSPAAHTMWFILFAIFFLLSRIADQMTVIALVGFISNLVGAFFFKISGIKRKADEDQT